VTADPSELENAILNEDLDLLLSLVSLDDIAAAWCRDAALSRAATTESPAHRDRWAWEFFNMRSLRSRSNLFREVLLKIIDRAEDDLLCSVGAGPLETFFSSDTDDMAWLADQARRSERFRRAMSCLSRMNSDDVRVLVDEGRWTFLIPGVPSGEVAERIRQVELEARIASSGDAE